MAILFPGSSIERGNWLTNAQEIHLETDDINSNTRALDCLSIEFFSQVEDVDIEYAGLAQTGTHPGSPNNISAGTREAAMRNALSRAQEYSWFPGNVFRNVLSPTFTPGAVRTITRETGNYQEYAGTAPSELTFGIKGANPKIAVWSRTYLQAIRPMSMGVYLKNNKGEVLGLMVGTVNNDTLLVPSTGISKYAFLPIPILGIRRSPLALGGLEEPDVMGFSILFPPNWDSPYAFGSSIDNMPASLKSIANRLGRIVWSHLALAPRSIVDLYPYING